MFIYLKVLHGINLMTGAQIIVNQVNLNDNNSMFRNTEAIDNAIVKRKGSRICRYGDCEKTASFNEEGERRGLYCKLHATPDMVDVVNPTCKHPECKRQPTFNYEGESKGLYCKEHAEPGMVDVKNPRCKHPSCNKQPSYNKEGERKGLFCSKHAEPGMVNVVSRRCKTPFCETRANKKYKGYCLRCYIHTFPNEPVTRNYKTKEKAVADRITEKFSNMTWTLDKTVEGGCSRKRPDLLCDMGPYILIIEIDEDKHVNYNCENKRMMELFRDVGNRPIVFIRFNPDSYKNKEGKRVTSCWRANKRGIMSVVKSKEKEWENRLKDLFEKIEYWSKNEPSKTITVEQLFYDELNDE